MIAALALHPFLAGRALFPELENMKFIGDIDLARLQGSAVATTLVFERASMTDSDLIVVREDGATRGRYLIRLAPGFEAEMTFHRVADGTMTIDHTGVPPEYEGRGIAARLVNRAIADAREQGFKITPVCSYVVAQFRRHPEWSDLRA